MNGMAVLDGKIAIVTGGNRGIGQGIALAFAKAGAQVVIAARDMNRSQEVVSEIGRIGGRAIAIPVDVTNRAQVHALLDRTVEAFGGVDILVNNAGILSVSPVEQMEESDFDEVMQANLKSVFLCSKAAIPLLKQRGGGRIINISSLAGKQGFPTLAHYCASKHAIIGFSSALAKELVADGITVNVICPGIVWTQMWEQLSKKWAQPGESIEDSWSRHQKTLIPQGRAQTSEDMGRLAVFFASMDSVTAQAWNVDGGM